MFYDVVIIGGGLAGLSCARQLYLNNPNISICVLEKRQHPTLEACHKVGESSVEIGAHYFGERLKLKEHIQKEQLPKLGLRFFFPSQDNLDISSRYEIGPSIFPTTPSYQLDRGRFENYLFDVCLENGIKAYDECSVTNIQLAGEDLPEDANHCVKYKRNDQELTCEAKWLIDASGRYSAIKRKLKLQKDVKHLAHAAWFRLKANFDIDSWSENEEWKNRMPTKSRRLSTNHFMGKGYWLWFIPLSSGYTSIGLVVDSNVHEFSHLRNIESVMSWLHEHEPDCAKRIEEKLDTLSDFKCLRNYAHGCKEVYSKNRWCITGEAGVFVDPFYSPGSDLIAISNDYICDLITRVESGEAIEPIAQTFNRLYLQIFEVILLIYEGLYPQFGNAKSMTQKILWDSAIYLGVTSVLYFNKKLTDMKFMEKISNSLSLYNRLNFRVQNYLKQQPTDVSNKEFEYGFLDLARTDFFGSDLNRQLGNRIATDDELLQKIKLNIDFLEKLAAKIINDEPFAPPITFCNSQIATA